MSEMPDVSTGEIIEAGWTNDVKNRTLQRYVNVATRDAENPAPTEGELAFVASLAGDAFQVYQGGTWHPVAWVTGASFSGELHVRGGLNMAGLSYLYGLATVNVDGDATDALDVSLNVGVANGDPTIGNSSVFTMRVNSLRVGQLAIEKNGTSMWYRGIAADGPGWGTWVPSWYVNGLAVNNVAGFFAVPAVWSQTSGSGANMVVTGATGQIVRSTASSRRYKRNIVDLDIGDGDLRPRKFNYIPGYVGDDPEGVEDHWYFVAEEVHEAFGETAIERNEDGEIEDVNLKAVVAILAAKVAKLEEQLSL